MVMAPRPAMAAQQRQQQQRQTPFVYATTRTRSPLTDTAFTAEGQAKAQDLLATGYGAYLRVQLYGYIQTGTSAAGTFDANYWPYNILNRLAVRSNGGFEFYNTEGWMNLLVQKYHRLGFDPSVPISPLTGYSTTFGARNAIQVAPAAGSSIASSTRYPIMVNFLIPFVSHPDLRAGLLPLQNNATRVTLYTTLNTAAGILGSGGTFGTGASINLVQRTQLEFFSVPANGGAQPDLSFIHRIIQDTQGWTASGDQAYRVPVNGVILRAWEHFRNAGVPAKFFATANDPTTQNFGLCTVRYAASQNPEVYDFKHGIYQHRLDYLTDTPDGTILFDFASGGGSIEVGVSARDTYNTRMLTEFTPVVNTSIAPSANSTLEVVRQELQPRAKAA